MANTSAHAKMAPANAGSDRNHASVAANPKRLYSQNATGISLSTQSRKNHANTMRGF